MLAFKLCTLVSALFLVVSTEIAAATPTCFTFPPNQPLQHTYPNLQLKFDPDPPPTSLVADARGYIELGRAAINVSFVQPTSYSLRLLSNTSHIVRLIWKDDTHALHQNIHIIAGHVEISMQLSTFEQLSILGETDVWLSGICNE